MIIMINTMEPRNALEGRAHFVHPAAVRCDMVLHRAFCARHVRKDGIGGEVRHGECYIGRFVRDIFKQLCNTSPPQGVPCVGWHYLSNATCLKWPRLFCVIRRVKDLHDLLHLFARFEGRRDLESRPCR